MNWDKRYLAIGILFLILSINCIVFTVKLGFTAYYATGIFLFTFIGIAFIRRSKN